MKIPTKTRHEKFSSPAIDDMQYKAESDDRECVTQVIYVIAIVVWFILIIYLCLYKTTSVGFGILLMPIIIFIIGFCNAGVVTESVEKAIFRTNYTGVGFLFLVPLLAWVSKSYCGDKEWYIAILMTSIIVILLSLTDLWIPKKWYKTYRHAVSTLQTMALFLIIFALYSFYLSSPVYLSCV